MVDLPTALCVVSPHKTEDVLWPVANATLVFLRHYRVDHHMTETHEALPENHRSFTLTVLQSEIHHYGLLKWLLRLDNR